MEGGELGPAGGGLLRCGQCDYQASVTAGTIFQDTCLPLRTWFRTMWWVTSQKNGVSALGLQKHLGSGKLPYRLGVAAQAAARDGAARPRTAQRSRGGRRDLCGGRRRGTARTADAEKSTGSHRRRGRRRGDRKDPYEAHPRSVQATVLHGFIQEAVEPDSTIHTDGWEGYVGLEALGYRHEYDFLAGSSQSASELLPHVHRVAALLKRWLIGTHQGAVSREHLDYYLDEYTFRFNRRRSRHRGKLFYRLVQQAATVGPTTYSEMVQHLRGRRDRPTTRCGVVGSEVHTPTGPIYGRHRLCCLAI